MNRIRKISIVIILLLTGIASLGFYLPAFLSLNKPVESGNILIEAWISHNEIEKAVKQFKDDPDVVLFVVGRSLPLMPVANGVNSGDEPIGKDVDSNGTWLYTNSSLGIDIPASASMDLPDTVRISVEAKGQEAGGRYAYFNLVVNGVSLDGTFTKEAYDEYSFLWITGGQPLGSLYVRFDNDLALPDKDRNLNIRSVHINGRKIPVNSMNSRITGEMSELTSGYSSQSAEVAGYIQKLGIEEHQVRIISFDPPARNLTLAAARQFKVFAAENKIRDFNAVSSGIHCRRTWITYKKTMGSNSTVGILNYNPDCHSTLDKYSDRPFVYHLAEEGFAYMINWIQLTLN